MGILYLKGSVRDSQIHVGWGLNHFSVPPLPPHISPNVSIIYLLSTNICMCKPKIIDNINFGAIQHFLSNQNLHLFAYIQLHFDDIHV